MTFPAHAELLLLNRYSEDGAVRTMEVRVEGGQVCFRYRPAFVLRCSADELAGVLQHEIAHVVLGHVWADARDYPDRRARIIAEEVSANELIQGKLPGDPLLLAHFSLPPGEDTATRYARLAGKTEGYAWIKRFVTSQAVQTGVRGGACGPSSGQPCGSSAQQHWRQRLECLLPADWPSEVERILSASAES